ncbi:dipeptidase PepE [Sodalis sp.]|uniref:dipeptidase PepE n=1 Tax=Sodalis sp. (in: enterobacteria) TaxID=1898979 RepID=UPI0038730C49
MQLLLLSNSTCPGKTYLEHAIAPIGELLRGRRQALFVPFAGGIVDWDAYTDKVRQALTPLGVDVMGIHRTADAGAAIATAEIIIVGGGNTFHLVKHCRDRGLLRAIHRRVQEGAAYIGWSAGANLACPTLCTTNDMPIVDPGGFDALGLINFQINPHYTNQLPAGHQGETRQQRLDELLPARPEMTVVGLPEGDWLTVADGAATLAGPYDAALYRADFAEPGVLTPGSTISLK